MTTIDNVQVWFNARRETLPTWAALAIFIGMITYGQLSYGGILKYSTISNLLMNNTQLVIIAIALTFVIITGGIDLSVGAVIAFSSVTGVMLTREDINVNPWLVMLIMVLLGTLIGLMSGILIQYFKVQPFIATLAMMFLARGLASMISTKPEYLNGEAPMHVQRLDSLKKPLAANLYEGTSPEPTPFTIDKIGDPITLIDGPKVNDLEISVALIITVVIVAVAVFMLGRTRFGRTVYAIGGKEQSAVLMGLPVHRTKMWVYVISGTLSGIAAVLFTARIGTAQNIVGLGWELDAIAAAVIGGTLLTGGAGYVLGSVVGALTLPLMGVLMFRDGGVKPETTTIITGVTLLLFVMLQRVVVRQRK